jgi:hypothetical protein
MKLKKCSKCKKEFPATSDYFYKNKSKPDGLGYYCKECDKEGSKKRYEENREKERERNRKRCKTLKGKFNRYKSGAKERGIPFELTLEDFEFFWQKPCDYCGDPIETIGLDRVDSSKGYTIDNVAPCCSFCNYSKKSHSLKEYIEHCKRVVNKSKSKDAFFKRASEITEAFERKYNTAQLRQKKIGGKLEDALAKLYFQTEQTFLTNKD